MPAFYGALAAAELDDHENEATDTSYAPRHVDTIREKLGRGFSGAAAIFISVAIIIVIVVMADIAPPSLSEGTPSFLFSRNSVKKGHKTSHNEKPDTSATKPVKTSVATSSNTLFVSTVSNEYGLQNSSAMLPYNFLSDSFLIEPYKEMTIALADPYSGCTYIWSLFKTDDRTVGASGESTDGSITVTLDTAGRYRFNVTESCEDTSTSSRQLTMIVWVKYIRRELSDLNDVDREEFLDAFHTLWTVSTADGIVLYGDRYKSINYFAILHNDGGGNSACDEFHGGLGFLNNHIYLSAYMEQSLQLVNPRVALHYLEYSKHFASDSFAAHLHSQLDGGSWTEILTSKFFGASDPISGKVIDGRWESTPIPYITDAFLIEEGVDPDHTFFPLEESAWMAKSTAHLNSPYGLLRSPWNYNPSPFLTRFGSVFRINDTIEIGDRADLVFANHMGVTCTDYKKFFKTVSGKPLQTYLIRMEDNTHGLFHFTFGGVGGDQAAAAVDTLMNDYDFTYSNIVALAISAQPFFKKNLALGLDYPLNCTTVPWQNDVLTSNKTVSEVGGPTCAFSDQFYSGSANVNKLVSYFFDIDPDVDDSVVAHIETFTLKERKAIMKIVANMFPYDGDLAGAGAALDPLFWVAHGAMERSYQKSVLAGIFEDMEYDTYNHCSGHNYNSRKAWLQGFFFPNETILAETLTNTELTAILNPTSDDYPYLTNFVYDTASFDWCKGSEAWFEV